MTASEAMRFVLLLLTYIALLMMAAMEWAHPQGLCLSKSEARKLWPTRHIYWYGRNRCWSNRRGGPPRSIRIDPIGKIRAEAKGDKLAVIEVHTKWDEPTSMEPDEPIAMPADSNPTPDMLLQGWPWLIDGSEPLQEFGPWDRRVSLRALP